MAEPHSVGSLTLARPRYSEVLGASPVSWPLKQAAGHGGVGLWVNDQRPRRECVVRERGPSICLYFGVFGIKISVVVSLFVRFENTFMAVPRETGLSEEKSNRLGN